MKKLYTLVTAVLLCLPTFAQDAVTVPYRSDFAYQDGNATRFEAGWTQIDANDDNSIWSPTTDTGGASLGLSKFCAKYGYNSSNQANDFLISPSIEFEAGKEYKIMFWYHTKSNYKESFTVYASAGTTPTEILAGTKLKELLEVSNTTYTKVAIDYVPAESGATHISFHATSDKNLYDIILTGFQVVENAFAPSPVKNLTATRGENRELSCKLVWELPTTDIFDAPLPEDKSFEKIEIFRDGGETAIATLGGDATSFTDTESTGLTSGFHTYKVSITMDGATTSAEVGPTSYVGPLAPTPVPAEFSMTSSDSFDLWTVVEGERTNTETWKFYDYSDKCIRYSRGYQKDENDWLISPPLQFTEPGAYQISFDCKTGYSSGAKLECYFGNSTDTEDMQLRLESLPIAMTRGWGTFYVNVTEPGTYYAALRAANPTDAAQTYSIFGMKVEGANIMPKPVTELTATPVGQENKVKLSFFLSNKTNTDEALSADNVQVKIYLVKGTEETLAKTLSGTELTLGATNEVEIAVESPGIYTFHVCTANAQDEAVEKHPSVTTSWIGDRLVALPYSIDFSVSDVDDSVNIWDIIDANADGKTWERKNYYGMRCVYPVAADGVQNYDDYLISPNFDLEPGYYMVRYKVSGGSYGSKKLYYNIGFTEAGTFTADNKPELSNKKLSFIEESTATSTVYTFHVEKAGRYQVVIAATEPNAVITSDYQSLTVKDFAISSCQVLPDVATDIMVVADPDKALKATVTWTNPTATNIEGLTLNSGELVKAVILRDGEAVGTVTEGLVPGETTSFTDTDIPQAGVHVYAVEIYNANGKSETPATTVNSPWIGSGLQTPYTADNYTAFSQWSIVNANGDTNYYGDVTWTVEANKDYASLTSTSKDADDWIISPVIDIKNKSVYKIEVRMRQSSSSSYYAYESPMQLWAGTGEDYNSFTKVASFTLAKEAISGNEQTDVFYVRTFAEIAPASADEDVESNAATISSGEIHFAIRCVGRADLRLESFTITYEKESSGETPQPGEHECKGIALPYNAFLATSSTTLAEGWSIKDANDDNTTWKATSDGDSGNKFAATYGWNSINAADDYMLSPLFHFSAGTEYKIIYNCRAMSSSGNERLKVYLSESDVPAEIKGSTLLHSFENFPSVYNTTADTFTPAADVDAHVVFYACSDADQYGIYVSDVSIVENKFSPKPVSNLTATVAPNRELKITLGWVLPTESIFNDPFTAEQTIEKIEIFRDGGETAIATLTEALTSFEDTEATGLTAGKHSYTVTVTVAGESASASVGPTSFAGPLAPSPVPVTFTIADEDEATLWTIVSEGSSTSIKWEYYSPSYGSYTPSFRLGYYSGDVVKDWLITPPIAISEPGYYRVTVSGRNTDEKSILKGCFGTSMNPADFKVCDELAFSRTESSLSYDFYAAEAGTYYAAVLADIESPDQSNSFYISALSVAASEFVPAPVTELSAVPDGENTNVILSWKNPSTDFGGCPISADSYKLEIYRNEELVKTIEGTDLATDGSFNSYTDAVPQAGVYTYNFKTVSNAGASAPKTVSITTGWIGSRTVALPYEINFGDDEGNESRLIWEFVDANNDGTTWTDDSWAGISLEFVRDTSTSPAQAVFNDYVLTPNFNLEPGYYKFSFELRGGSPGSSWSDPVEIPYTVGYFTAGTFNAEAPEFIAEESGVCSQVSYEGFKEFLFKVEESGTYQLALGCSGNIPYSYSYTKISARKFIMEQSFIVPKAATDLAVVPAADSSLQATVTWTNPTATNIEGVSLSDGDIVKAVIVRDGEEVATVTEGLVPGETTSFLDTTVSQAGPHIYSVDIYNVNGKNEEESPVCKSEWIGGNMQIPYQASTAADFNLWNFVNADGDADYWNDPITWKVFEGASDEYLHIICTDKVADDWAITPAITLEASTIYEVTVLSAFFSPYSANENQTLGIGISSTGAHTDMENIYTIEMDAKAFLNNPKADTFLLLTPGSEPAHGSGFFDDFGDPVEELTKVNVSAGTQHFGIHSGAQGEIVIRSFSITKKGSTTGIDGVIAKDGVIYADGRLVFDGKADISIFNVAGTLVAVEHGVEKTFSLDNLSTGVYMVSLTFENGKTTVLKVVK